MSRHVLIIGGGVIGLSAARFCIRAGLRVTVVERGGPEHDCCSMQNAGMVVPSHFIPLAAPGMVALGLKWMWNPESPFYIKPRINGDLFDWGMKFWKAATPEHVNRSAPLIRDLSLASRALFEEMASDGGADFGLVKKGLLMLCKSAHALEDEALMAARAKGLGIPAEVLDAAQTAKLEPNVRMDIAGSVYFPKDCHLAPHLFQKRLYQEVEKAGGRFLWNTEVKGWRTGNGVVRSATTDRGDLQADEYLLCGGAWSPTVAGELGLSIPIQAGKGYSLTLQKPRQLPAICSIFTEARVAVTPVGGALRVGGTMEIAGLNEDINPVRVKGIVKAVPKYYPDFKIEDFDGIQPWRGLRPCSPDGMPYLGRTKKFNNLTLATGHAMMGLSLAPITGKLVAEMLTQTKPSLDISLLSPDRYSP